MKIDEMDGMDSLSTTSDHSVASSPPSPQYNSKAISPLNHLNNDKQFSIKFHITFIHVSPKNCEF